MKEKWTGENKNNSGVKVLEEECMVVQRLSVDASGKAQKYSGTGAREFVTFECDKVNVDNKTCLLKPLDVCEMVCDVGAGKQGHHTHQLIKYLI